MIFVRLLLLTGFLHVGHTCLTFNHCSQQVEQQICPQSLAAHGESGTSLQMTQRNDFVFVVCDLIVELLDSEASIIF